MAGAVTLGPAIRAARLARLACRRIWHMPGSRPRFSVHGSLSVRGVMPRSRIRSRCCFRRSRLSSLSRETRGHGERCTGPGVARAASPTYRGSSGRVLGISPPLVTSVGTSDMSSRVVSDRFRFFAGRPECRTGRLSYSTACCSSPDAARHWVRPGLSDFLFPALFAAASRF